MANSSQQPSSALTQCGHGSGFPRSPDTSESGWGATLEEIGLLPGTVIDGVYRVIGPLGAGGMGVVVLAHETTLDRLVAIKLVRAELCDAAARGRFMSEARAMARVSHPNVLQIYAYGEYDGSPYFVMELVDGPTLEEWLLRNGSPPPLDTAVALLQGICDGISAIHAAETVHRDIKPSNILVDPDLRPRVADLGLAVLCRSDSPTKYEMAGTPAYMAPEQVFGGGNDAALPTRADVYSIGCLAYELFTGRPPFQSETVLGFLLQHAAEPVELPSALRPGLPLEVDAVILRALAKNPAERTATVDAFRRELLAACRGGREPVRILVAEDSAEFREALQVVLASEFAGVEIECVADGEAALAAFDRARPSIAIIDLRMPRVDGLELTRRMRARDPVSSMPIIVLTGSGGAEEWKQLAACGADRFLVKPVVSEDVVSIVRRCLEERSKGWARVSPGSSA
jgi:serine/threonine-protein kinase